MRRKIPYRVCRCTPDGVVTQLEARLPDQFQQEWDEEMDMYYREQETSRIFRDGQSEFLDAV